MNLIFPQLSRFFTIKEAAQKFGITPSSLYEWLDRHPIVKDQYCVERQAKNGKSVMAVSGQGMTVIANMKDKFRGNRSIQGNHESPEAGKKKVAEKAIANIQTENLLLKTAQILEQLNARVEQLEKGLKPEPEKKVLSLPQNVSSTFRELLVTRINDYASKKRVEHRDLWVVLYTQFQKKTGINLQALAEHEALKPLDVAQQNNWISELYQLAAQLYRVNESTK